MYTGQFAGIILISQLDSSPFTPPTFVTKGTLSIFGIAGGGVA